MPDGDEATSARARWMELGAATLAFAVLTCWFTFPQYQFLTSTPLHHDAYFSIWRITWIAHQLPRDPWHLFDGNIFVPATSTLAYSDAVLLEGLLASPLLWVGVPGVVAYNLLILGSFVFAGVGMFVLARHLTGSPLAAFVAGMIFAFAPFRIDHYFHLELLWSGWMPLTLWAFHRAVETNLRKWGLLTGVFLLAQVLSCIYYAVFLATLLAVATLWMLAARRLRMTAPAVRHLALGALLCGVLALPYAVPYARNASIVGTRSEHETNEYSAKLVNYLASPHQNWLYGHTETGNERQLFPGLTAIAFALVAVWPPLNRMRFRYALAAVFAIDLSLGFNGLSFRLLRAAVPIYHGLRVPARAAMLTLTVVAPLAAFGVARLLQARVFSTAETRTPESLRWRRALPVAVVVGICVLLVLEYTNQPLILQRLPSTGRKSMLATWLAQQPPTVIAEFPMPRADRLPGNEPQYQYVSTLHWQRLVNGYSGMYPPTYFRLLEIMQRFPEERAIAELKARGVSIIVLHPDLFRETDVHAIQQQLTTRPDVQFVGEMPDGFSVALVYRIAK